MTTSIRPLQSEMSYLDWPTTKTPAIRNHILTVSHRNAFVAILVPKLMPMVTPLVYCVRMSLIHSLIAQTLSQSQTLHWYIAYNWSYGHSVRFFPILAKIWLSRKRPIDPWPAPKTMPYVCQEAELCRFECSRQVYHYIQEQEIFGIFVIGLYIRKIIKICNVTQKDIPCLTTRILNH